MNQNQTGSQTGETLPQRVPGASLLENSPPRRRPGWHRKPQRFSAIRHAGSVAVLCLIALASCGTPAPAAPAAGWTTPGPVPASTRVIEVVDRIGPTNWKVSAAAEWLDQYTASDMRLVSRCSGKAYRCITVRQGKLPGSLVGWAKGSTITIDTAKVARSEYSSVATRKRLLAHELAHTFGLHHGGRDNLLAPTVDRMRLSLTPGQRRHLATR